MERLGEQAVAGLASLVAIGRQSGDTVVGLSAVRRTEGLAWVFADERLAERTLRELAGREREGARLVAVGNMEVLTRKFGRQGARVVGVKQGSLARGIAGRLQGLQREEK
jgi:hypothetical protein